MQAILDFIGKIVFTILIGIMFFLVWLESLFSGPAADNPLDIARVCEDLRMDISQGVVLENWDTHGGFLGDGTAFVSVQFSPEQAEEVENYMDTTYWHSLPLTDNLDTMLYSGSYLRDDEDALLVPPVENGFYYFRDRNSKSVDDTDDTPLFSQGSFNFTLAVYDSDAHIIYYITLDT